MELGGHKLVICQPNYLSLKVFPVMEQLKLDRKLCDVTLKVEEQSFTAHRIVLAAAIPYFHAMFTIDMAESRQREINIQGIDAIAFESLVNFAYSGKVEVNEANVQALFLGASFMQLTEVQDACSEFLAARLDSSNVLGIRSLAKTIDCTLLVKAADKYIDRHFHDVAMSKEYLSVSPSDLLDIVRRDQLHVTSEEQVFEAVMRWVKEGSPVRRNDLPQLLAQVRMQLLSPQYLADRASLEELVHASDRCRDLIDEAINYQLMPECRHLHRTFCTQPRNYIEGHIFALVHRTTNLKNDLKVFDHSVRKWQSGIAMSRTPTNAAVAVMSNKLYVCGGHTDYQHLSSVTVFDVQQHLWHNVASMHGKRVVSGAAALHGKLYVCGGCLGTTTLDTVECYHPDRDEWTVLQSMAKPRSCASVVAFNGFIYAIGGYVGGGSFLASVERFDPAAGRWTTVVPMLTRRCRLAAAVLDGKLYVCGGFDGSKDLQTVEMFDPATNVWQHVAPMKIGRSRHGAVSHMGKLWVIGGVKGAAMEVYDPGTDAWSFSGSLTELDIVVGVGVIDNYVC